MCLFEDTFRLRTSRGGAKKVKGYERIDSTRKSYLQWGISNHLTMPGSMVMPGEHWIYGDNYYGGSMVLMVDISNPLGRNKETNLYPTMMQWILATHCDDVDPTAFQIRPDITHGAPSIQTSVPWNPIGFPLCLLGTFYWGGAKTFMWHLPISPRALTKRPLNVDIYKSSKTFEDTYRLWSIHIYIYLYSSNFLNAFRICRMKLENIYHPSWDPGRYCQFYIPAFISLTLGKLAHLKR